MNLPAQTRPRFFAQRRLACFILLVLFFSGCAEVPLTERKSLSIVPHSDVVALGFQEYRQVLKKAKLSRDPEKVAMVRQVGKRIARAAEWFLRKEGMEEDLHYYHWEFNLIENDKVINAWCMPGGKIAVYTGILPVTRDENGLAVVLGHEVGHAIAHHGDERLSQNLLANFGGMALSVALAQRPQATRELAMAAFGMGANIGFLLPYSRIQESEADRIGLMLMAKAGYNPKGAVSLWMRMKQQGGKTPPALLSTHPAPSSRIADIRHYLPEAMALYRRSR
ncbi:MAG: M48 family metallopeptidase [Deltaproteobacteria bacterium]|nr:M48 family metallopeptidase [Deltaproteobacteria bacterium]